VAHNIIIQLQHKFYEALIFESTENKEQWGAFEVCLFTQRQMIRLCHEAGIELAMIIL
jgi:hypothetical protein